MPTNRENDRRDKALESIAKHLGDISESLKKLAKNSEKSITVFNNLAETRTRPDPFDQPQEPQPGEIIATSEPGKNDSTKTHPYANRGGYFARSEPVDDNREDKSHRGLGSDGEWYGEPIG